MQHPVRERQSEANAPSRTERHELKVVCPLEMELLAQESLRDELAWVGPHLSTVMDHPQINYHSASLGDGVPLYFYCVLGLRWAPMAQLRAAAVSLMTA